VGPNACCEIFQFLAERFSVNARLYAEAVVRLTTMQRMEPGEYALLRQAVHQALERAEKSRAAFEQHVASHECTAPRTSLADTPEARRSAASG
jgi:hypothetical protein